MYRSEPIDQINRTRQHQASNMSAAAASLRRNQNQNPTNTRARSVGSVPRSPTGTWFWISRLLTDSPAESRAGGNASCRGVSVIPRGWRRRRMEHHGCLLRLRLQPPVGPLSSQMRWRMKLLLMKMEEENVLLATSRGGWSRHTHRAPDTRHGWRHEHFNRLVKVE